MRGRKFNIYPLQIVVFSNTHIFSMGDEFAVDKPARIANSLFEIALVWTFPMKHWVSKVKDTVVCGEQIICKCHLLNDAI